MSHETQPHSEYGAHGHEGHGHVIVPIMTLRLVLGALLFFTLLTVGLAKAEGLVGEMLHVEIPQAINVFVAISIAAVKTAIVVLFFMQLKYDNPLNGMIFIFTLITAAFFLGFTALDLGNRRTIDQFKGHYISPGGTWTGSNTPLTVTAREEAIQKNSPLVIYDHGHHGHLQDVTDAGYYQPMPEKGSSADFSRPVTDEGDGHGEHGGGHEAQDSHH